VVRKSKTVSKLPVSYGDIVSAAMRLEGFANKTPVMKSRTLDKKLGAKVFLKCENF